MIERVLRSMNPSTDVLMHGDCRGADRIADTLAVAKFGYCSDMGPSSNLLRFPYIKGLGRAGGPARNKLMLKEGKPTEVHAFKDDLDYTLTRGGTENMMRLALDAGVPVTLNGWHFTPDMVKAS